MMLQNSTSETFVRWPDIQQQFAVSIPDMCNFAVVRFRGTQDIGQF